MFNGNVIKMLFEKWPELGDNNQGPVGVSGYDQIRVLAPDSPAKGPGNRSAHFYYLQPEEMKEEPLELLPVKRWDFINCKSVELQPRRHLFVIFFV